MVTDIPLVKLHVPAGNIPLASQRDYQYLRLLESMRDLGLLVPLVVSERAGDTYLIIDGARRYFCGKELDLATLPCVVKPPLNDGEYHRLRFELHTRVEPWNHQEYANWLKRFRAVRGKGE
jgi:ParB-like chromosome segregation protein Spo0J